MLYWLTSRNRLQTKKEEVEEERKIEVFLSLFFTVSARATIIISKIAEANSVKARNRIDQLDSYFVTKLMDSNINCTLTLNEFPKTVNRSNQLHE